MTFAGNGATDGTMADQTVPYDTATALSANAFTRDGYTFAGWNGAADGTGTAYAAGANVTLTGDLTLYAQWSKNFTPPPPSDDDGGDSTPTTFAPMIAAAEHGRLTVEPQNAKIGDKVTILAVSDAGWQFARVTVTDVQGKKVPVRYENGKPTFTQPVGPVKIEGVFAPVPEPLDTLPPVVSSPQSLTVNGAAQSVEAYNVGGTNFFKLRDLAALLRGTAAQFDVRYDAARRTVVLTTGKTYEGEVGTGFADLSATAVVSSQTVEIDGRRVELTAVNIGGSNFFGLRELAAFLGFGVEFDAATNTARVTG